MTAEEFHDALHVDVGKPRSEVRVRNVGKWQVREVVKEPWAHRAAWATATVKVQSNTIKVQVNLNLKRNGLSQEDYARLSNLVFRGIRQFWSRAIYVRNVRFAVDVDALQMNDKALGIDLYIEKSQEYSRSSNLAILGIDASLYYNGGAFPSPLQADEDFMLTAAHEFGHSVLMEFGGLGRSWTHKDSTSLLQATKTSTPGYPGSGEIDLMNYYDSKKSYPGPSQIFQRSCASELDVKSLLWMSQLSF